MSSTRINPYLNFNGNCREAMTFYRDCLGGKLMLQVIADSPAAAHMPPEAHQNIMHAVLQRDELIIMGSDMIGDGLKEGNSVALMLDCSSEDEIYSLYDKLSAGGQPTHPLKEEFWGAIFGNLNDKFGNSWLLNFDLNAGQTS